MLINYQLWDPNDCGVIRDRGGQDFMTSCCRYAPKTRHEFKALARDASHR